MFHPVGSQPPSVYWRRRLSLIGALVLVVVLIVLTIAALRSSDSPTAGGTTSPPKPTGAASGSSAPAPPTTSGGSTSGGSTSGGSPAASGSSSVMPATCSLADLSVTAVVGKATYAVGEKPLVEMQVTNTGTAPCVRDLADSQIELKVYNGTSRVWGSHDCAVKAGTDNRTLVAGQPYRFAILWGGKTSMPQCTQATRQQVGAGTYTLYATLAGKTGKAAQFNIS